MTSLYLGIQDLPLHPTPLFVILAGFADIGMILSGLLLIMGIAKILPRFFPNSRISLALKKWADEATEDE